MLHALHDMDAAIAVTSPWCSVLTHLHHGPGASPMLGLRRGWSVSNLSLWAHAQTVTAALPFARPLPRGLHHEVFELALGDGGVLVAAATFHAGIHAERRPCVVVLHGVSGSSE